MASEPQVLLSYSRHDMDAARALTSALEVLDLRVWFDVNQINAGDNWQNLIEEAIRDSDVFLALISETSLDSPLIKNEYQLGMNLGKIFVPVKISPSVSLSKLPLEMMNYQIIDASDATPDRWTRVAEAIKKLTCSASLPTLTPENATAVHQIASVIAADRRGQAERSLDDGELQPNSVFLVHGHDEAMLREVEAYVVSLGVRAVVMKDIGDQSHVIVTKVL